MRKILKFLSYSLLYMFISVASAYGVITISLNNVSNEQSGSGGQQAPVVIAEEINSIITNFTQAQAIDLEVQASVNTGDLPIAISLGGQVDLSGGFTDIKVDANLNLAIDQTNFDVGLVYQNGYVYFELLNGKFMLATDNIMDSIGQITGLLGVELPDISSLLGNLDFNAILGLLSNFEKVENEESVSLVIDMSMLEGLMINLDCSLDYHLLGFSLPEFTLSGTSISASANIDYPESAEISEVTPSQYIDLTDVIEVGVSVIDFFSNEQFAFDLGFTYNDNLQLNGKLYLDTASKSAKLIANYKDYTASILFIDNTIYVEAYNVYLKFDISKTLELCQLLENYLGITLPNELIDSIISWLNGGDFSAVTKNISLPASFEQIDLSTIDLGIIESFVLDEKGATLVLKDLGQFAITMSEGQVTGVTIDAFDINASLSVINYTAITKSQSEENYVELSELLPTLDHILALLESDTFTGSANITFGSAENEKKLTVNYTLYKGENPYAILSTTLFGHELKVTIINGNAYIEVSSTKLVCKLDNLPSLIEKVTATFSEQATSGEEATPSEEVTTPSEENTTSSGEALQVASQGINGEAEESSLIDMAVLIEFIEKLLDSQTNPLLITGFTKNDNGISLSLLNKLTLTITNSTNAVKLTVGYDNITVDATLEASSQTLTAPAFTDSEFTAVEEVIDSVINIYNYVMEKQFYLSFDAKYQDITLEGGLNYANDELGLSLLVKYSGLEANVMLYQNVVYIEVENIKLKFSLKDIDSVKAFLNDYFQINLDQIINDLIGNTSEATSGSTGEATDSTSDTTGSTSGLLDFLESELDLEAIIKQITFALTSEKLEVKTLDEKLLASVNFIENMLSSLNLSYQVGTQVEQKLTANIYVEETANTFAPSGDYIDVATLLDYVKMVLDYVNGGQLELGLDLVFDKTAIKGNVQLDMTDTLLLSASVQVGSDDINVNIEDSMLYFDYNGLLLKMDNSGFNELLYIVLEVIGFDTTTIPFLSEIDLDLDFSMIDTDIASLDLTAEEIINLIKMVKELSVKNSALTIKLDGKRIYNNQNATDITITLASENGAIKSLSLDNCFIDNTLKQEISGEITVNPTTTFKRVDKTKNYIDISGANELVKAIVNMSNDKQFHVSGSFDVVGSLGKFDIAWNVPFDFYINVVGKADIELYGVIGEIPTMPLVNNDVPYKLDDTDAGSDRYLYIYYQSDYIYLYRSENVGQFFGPGRTYEKCTKVALDTFLDNILYYVQYCFGFTDTIMEAIIDSMNNPRTEPMDFGNIIRSFTAVNNKNFTINLNMYELTNNPDLDNLAISLGIDQTSDGRNYIRNLQLSLNMPLADIFSLTLSTSDTQIVDYGKSVDMSKLYEFVNNYKYASESEWEASDGNWSMVSETLYTINFVTNNGTSLEPLKYSYKDILSLPVLEDYVVDNGTSYTAYTFVGWFEDEALTKEFTGTTMPRGDLSLYAKFDKLSRNYYTLDFVTDSEQTFDKITKLEGESITLPTPHTKEVTEGTTTYYYNFAGWYTSSSFEDSTSFNQTTMPSQNITLYAKWEFDRIEATSAVNIYDNNVLVDTLRVKSGDTIDFTNANKVNEDTLFYYDANYSKQITDFTMPAHDIDIHIRNLYTVTFVHQYDSSQNVTAQFYQGQTITNLPTLEQYIYDDGTQTAQQTLSNTGFDITSYVMPNSDVAFNATWEVVDTKYYYTITFNVLDNDLGVGLDSSPWKDNAKLYYKGVETTQMSYCFLEGEVDLSDFTARCKYTTGKWFVVYWYYVFQGWKDANDNIITNNIYNLTGDVTIEADFSSLQRGEEGYNQN